MNDIRLRSLGDMLNDKDYAKEAVGKLIKMPVTSYYEGFKEDLMTLRHMSVLNKRFKWKLEYFPDLSYVYSHNKDNGWGHEVFDVIYAPIIKSDYLHKSFAFSISGFLDAMDELYPDEEKISDRIRIREGWKKFRGYSVNQVVKKFYEMDDTEKRYGNMRALTCIFITELLDYVLYLD